MSAVAPGRRWLEWAGRIAGRAGRFSVRRTACERALLRRRALPSATHRTYVALQPSFSQGFTFAPTVNFSLVAPPHTVVHQTARQPGVEASPARFPQTIVVRRMEVAPLEVQRRELARTLVSAVETVVERISRTARRAELRAATDSCVVASQTQIPAQRDVARALPAGSPPHMAAELVSHASPAWPPVPAPPVNIEQLTDQVARRLDHRLVAWSERTGRV